MLVLAAGHMMSPQAAHALAWVVIAIGMVAAARAVLWVFGWR